MPLLATINRINQFFESVLQQWGGALLLLGLRLYTGWVFFNSGIVKVSNWPGTLALFQYEYKVPLLSPEIAAYAGAFGELAFPLLLFPGLLTRPAALGLFAVNAMAVISYPQLFQFECPAPINQHVYWGVSLLILAAFGGGRLSFDRLLGKRR